MKLLYLTFLFFISFTYCAKAVNVVIIESQSNNVGQNMDDKWLTACNTLGYTAAIYPQTQLDVNTWYSTTDILIVSAALINIPTARQTTIYNYFMQGGKVYIQSEYQATFPGNVVFEYMVNTSGGNFSWTGITPNYLQPMIITGSLATTPNTAAPFNGYWYGQSGSACGPGIEPFLNYGSSYYGFIYCPNTSNGRVITTTDQDFVLQNQSPQLLVNILSNLAQSNYACPSSLAVNLGPDINICSGAVKIGSHINNATYLWSTGATTDSITVSSAGVYWLRATTANCVSTDTIHVTGGGATSIFVTAAICQGETYTLPDGMVVSAAATYTSTVITPNTCDSVFTTTLSVYPPTSNIVNAVICGGQTYTRPNGTVVNTAGTYTDTLQSIHGCDSIITTNLTVNPTSTTQIRDTICAGQNYTLPTGNVVNTAGTYYDTLSTANGCDSIIITQLTVGTSTTIQVYDTICFGQSYTLHSGNIVNATGVYNDTIPTAGGCDSIIVTNLTVNQPLAGTMYDTICAGTTYTLPSGTTVNSTGTYTSTLTTAQGCDSVVTTYLTVNPVSASTVYDTICRGNNYSLPNGTAVNTSGSYPVTLSNQFGCDSVVTTILTVIGIDVTAQVNAVPCYGEAGGTITVTANGGLLPYDYSITSTNNTTTNSTTNAFNNVLADDYLVTVSDDYGCSTVITTTVTQPPLLIVSDTVINVSCYNDDNGQVIVKASGGTPAYIFSLTNQADNQSGMFSGLTADDYTYTVTDANGCLDTATVTVTQPNEIIIALNPDSVSIDLSESAQLLATTNYDPTANYNWSPASGLSCTNCPNPVVTANRSLVYSLEVSVNINGNNCYAYASVPVTVIPNYDIFIPNAFTPNGNGQNDFFRIYGNLPAVKYVEVAIFDRIGEMVFQTNDINFEWDGVYKGKLLQPGVYVYTIRVVFIDSHAEKLFKGSITLLR